MKILVATHTHTNVSTHAYHTLDEMTSYACELGFEAIAITNHGPEMPDAPVIWHFSGLVHLPKVVNGVRLLKGVEANIKSYDGRIDLPDRYLKKLDVVIASYHDVALRPATEMEHTEGWLKVIDNPYVDILGHLGTEEYKCDYEKVIRYAKEKGKIIEINNHSFEIRAGARENCREVALLCKKFGINIVVSSDAHSKYDIDDISQALEMLGEIDFPEELVLNTGLEKFRGYLNQKAHKNI